VHNILHWESYSKRAKPQAAAHPYKLQTQCQSGFQLYLTNYQPEHIRFQSYFCIPNGVCRRAIQNRTDSLLQCSSTVSHIPIYLSGFLTDLNLTAVLCFYYPRLKMYHVDMTLLNLYIKCNSYF